MLDALGEAAGERGRLHHRDHRGETFGAEGVHRRGDGALVARELRGQHEHRGIVAVVPVLIADRIGRAEVVEGDVALAGDEHALTVEVAVRDPGRVQPIELGPRVGEHGCGDLVVGEGADRPALWWGGDEHGGVGTAHPGAHEPGGVDLGALGEHQRVPDVLDLLDPAPEHRESRIVVHQRVPGLRRDARVALVATEGVDP